MSAPAAGDPEDLQARIRALEQENALLTERTKDLTLLGLAAELTGTGGDSLALVARLQTLNRNLDQAVAERTRQLRRSEERYHILFDLVPDGVLLVGAEDRDRFGRIEDANATAAAMHGYTLAELRELHVEALIAQGPVPPMESFEARVWRLAAGETVQEELRHRRKDGSTFPVEATGTLVTLQGRQYILDFCRDITARKQAEQALLLTQRTESIGLLAGGIAHDFNNLLTAIMGQAGLAMDHLAAEPRARGHLEKAVKAAERAAVLTGQILTYSGRGKLAVQAVPLQEMVQENLQFLGSVIPRQIRFQVDFAPGTPYVVADPGQLQQVIMNLVINGAEAIGERPGEITIRTRRLRLDRLDPARWQLGGNQVAPGEYVGLDIADTGCGMGPEVLARVFDPFFSTKQKGHGLGLSAVLGIIRDHRGALGVDSEPGVGTTFRILLPAGEGVPVTPPAAPAGGPEGAARTILVIDDEEYLLEIIGESLGLRGHTCVLARSGEEGLELAASRPAIDLVLLDLNMPGLGGVETLKALRRLDPGLPVLVSSGYDQDQAMAQLGALEPVGFLHKPYLAKALIQAVEAIPPRARQIPD